jgi:hypothetical protein
MGTQHQEEPPMSFDPVPANGEGSDVFDAPSLFYLTNRRLIDEWAGLKLVAAQSFSEWLGRTFRDSFAQAASGLNLSVSYVRGPGAFHHVVAHPEGMSVLNGRPVLGVGLGWPSKSVNPESSGSMFACVRVSRNKTGRAAAKVFLDNGGREYRQTHGLRGSDEAAWPVFRNLHAGEQWWTNLDLLCETLRTETITLVQGTLEAAIAAAQVEDQGGPDEAD